MVTIVLIKIIIFKKIYYTFWNRKMGEVYDCYSLRISCVLNFTLLMDGNVDGFKKLLIKCSLSISRL